MRDEFGRSPASLISEIFNSSDYFKANCSFTNEPVVLLLEQPKFSEEFGYSDGEAHFDPDKGEALIEITAMASPWMPLHEMAHLLAWEDYHGEQWLTHYRLLVKERYGQNAAELLSWIEPPETPANRLRFMPADYGWEV